MTQQWIEQDGRLEVLAPAKVNLTLLIAGKRSDGYHAIETVMAKINWFDQLTIEPCDNEFELYCQGAYPAPAGPENILWRTWKALTEATGKPIRAKMTLTKNIPAGSGLGSASSDAAAALLGMNHFFGLGLSASSLHHIASQLGSDVAFFLYGPLAYCTGRGEKILPLTAKEDFSALLIIPKISVSTKEVYANYRHSESVYRQWAEKIHPLIDKKDIDSAAKMCANMLEQTAFSLQPVLAEIKRYCAENFGLNVCLSGSGSAMYIYKPQPAVCEKIQSALKERFDCESRIVSNNSW